MTGLDASKPRQFDVVVLAGGRISGEFAEASGQTVKGLVTLSGVTLLRRVLDAAADCTDLARVVVVGPEALVPELRGTEVFALERGPALANLCAGMDALHAGADEHRDLLVLASDNPTLTPAALSDFLRRAPASAELVIPIIAKGAFQSAYPGNRSLFVKLAEGAVTMGGQALVSPAAIRRNLTLLQRLFDQRKSQVAMARTLGLTFLLRLLSGRLTVQALEARAFALTGCRSAAVVDCDPALAFDIDTLSDLRYLEAHPPAPWRK